MSKKKSEVKKKKEVVEKKEVEVKKVKVEVKKEVEKKVEVKEEVEKEIKIKVKVEKKKKEAPKQVVKTVLSSRDEELGDEYTGKLISGADRIVKVVDKKLNEINYFEVTTNRGTKFLTSKDNLDDQIIIEKDS